MTIREYILSRTDLLDTNLMEAFTEFVDDMGCDVLGLEADNIDDEIDEDDDSALEGVEEAMNLFSTLDIGLDEDSTWYGILADEVNEETGSYGAMDVVEDFIDYKKVREHYNGGRFRCYGGHVFDVDEFLEDF